MIIPLIDQLRMDLQDQLAEDQLAQLAVGDDLVEVRPFGLEVGQEVGPLLVPVDGIGEPALVPLPARDDLRVVLGQDVVDLADRVVPVDGDLGAIEQEHPLVRVDWQGSLLAGSG